jgi:xanthine dehydrogenase YagR molybdenum-binding subunit
MNAIGSPVPRIDGRAKVTGAASYSAEFRPEGMLFGAVVQSTIAFGRITAIDTAAAEAIPGVHCVLTHLNADPLPWNDQHALVDAATGEREKPLHSDRVLHQGQHIALVVADTPEAAAHAARLVQVSYVTQPAVVSIDDAVRHAVRVHGDQEEVQPGHSQRGAPEEAFEAAPVKLDQSYVMPRHNQNPMEPHATIAAWDGEMLTLWDKTQWTQNCRAAVAAAFGIAESQVRVICPFIGGAFGSSLRVWPHTFLAAMAARKVGRPVKIELSRREYYGGTGARPWTWQRVRIGAERDGTLQAWITEVIGETSLYEDYVEATPRQVRILHRCANLATIYSMARRATNTPNAMRAPGETTGLFASECALDELSYALGIDPVELRLRNLAEHDQSSGLPFSSNSHEKCLREGAARFGWAHRPAAPRSQRDGRLLVGQGMASAIYPVNISPARAHARLTTEGVVDVTTAASDMGPGTWTSLTQVAADALGVPMDQVNLAIGDSDLPQAPVHGGSMTMASVGHAVRDACLKLREAIRRRTGSNEMDLHAIARRLGAPIEADGAHDPGDLTEKFGAYAFGAVFAEVAVDPDTGETRVRRITGAYGNGRIINPRLARSQCIGGFMMGIGQALMERTEVDDRSGRIVNANLAEYLVPVLADTPDVEVIFVPEEDPHLGPLGAKGLGEIALCGIGPAIVNAIFHATGRRIRDLPVTPDKLIGLADTPNPKS